jgi:hypothetical protein
LGAGCGAQLQAASLKLGVAKLLLAQLALVGDRMKKVSTHLGSRLVWLALGCGLGASKIIDGLQHHQIDQLISGLGFALFGAAWFIQPLLPRIRSSEEIHKAMVGPAWLHTSLIFIGFSCWCIGLVLKHVVKV